MERDTTRLKAAIDIVHGQDEPFLLTLLSDIVMREGLAVLRAAWWHSKRRLQDLPADALLSAQMLWHRQDALLRMRGLLVHVHIDPADDVVRAYVYSQVATEGDYSAVIDQLKGWLSPRVEPAPDRVPVGFRFLSSYGPRQHVRSIAAPAWEEIRGNYPVSVRDVVEGLMSCTQPPDGGRLLLMHGPPGTGKTYVIRALARAWRAWCHFEYVSDPEVFFGNAAYIMQVLIEAERDDDGESTAGRRWRLLVLEDAGELLARDARAVTGQGLSRLLNLTEGLIGQGLRVLVLISTNEQLSSFHSAVARPGRACAEIGFGPLSVEEASAWLSERGRGSASGEMTLAELFAETSAQPQHHHRVTRHSVGLRRR